VRAPSLIFLGLAMSACAPASTRQAEYVAAPNVQAGKPMDPAEVNAICPSCTPASVTGVVGLAPDVSPADRAKRQREDELLERALTNSPDYMAALRRAAAANIAAEEPSDPPARRNRAAEAQAREQRITAEEARLSDAVEVRRRSRLAQQDQSDRLARIHAARAACDAQASSVGAGIYTPYSPRAGILGSALTGAIASASAEAQARAGCYRAYGL
jgi:hypothetical protein